MTAAPFPAPGGGVAVALTEGRAGRGRRSVVPGPLSVPLRVWAAAHPLKGEEGAGLKE